MADRPDIDRLAYTLHECLIQYERAMSHLGWTMINVKSHAVLDELVALARNEVAWAKTAASLSETAKKRRLRAEAALADRDRLAIDLGRERKLAKAALADRDRLADALDAIEAELGTLPLDHLGPATERAVNKAWAMAREKRPDPKLIPAALSTADRKKA